MELYKNIEKVLEKYFEGNTTIEEENDLKSYFSGPDVAQHLEQYKSLFGYFSIAGVQQFEGKLPRPTKKRKVAGWLSIAASVVVLVSAGTYAYMNFDLVSQTDELGTYESPEVAFRETQKALNLLSCHVNTGVEGVQYLQEFKDTKERIFPAF